MELPTRALALMLVSATMACAAARLPPAPPMADPPSGWIEMRSPHFTLRTDLTHDEAFDSIYRMELTWAALGLTLWGSAPLETAPVEVIQVRLPREMAEFGVEAFGTTLTSTRLGPLLIIGGLVNRQRDFVAAGALGTYLETQHHHHQPYWLRQGLGALLGTLRLAEGGDSLQVGGAFLSVRSRQRQNAGGYHGASDVSWLRVHGRLSAAELFAYQPSELGAEHDALRFESTSWLVVTYLRQTRAEAFRDYQASLDRGETYAAAWRASFPDLTPDALDHGLQVFLDEGVFLAQRLPLKPPPVAAPPIPGFAQRALDGNEVHALRALLFLAALGPRQHAERLTDARAEVNAIPPGAAPEASTIEALLEWAQPASLQPSAAQATAHSPDDPRAWRVLVASEVAPGQEAARAEAVERVLSLSPTAVDALETKTELLLASPRRTEALPVAWRAYTLRSDPTSLNLVARAEADAGRCTEATGHLRLAAALINPSDLRAVRWTVDAATGEVAAVCSPAAPPTAAALAPPPPAP